ncbi:MAG: T9SS type A sorting domain-containing protein [Bacteroidota bacterium]
MKKVYTLLMAGVFTINAMAQSAPGAAPTNLKTCNSSNPTCTAASTICPAGSPNTVTNFNDKQYVAGTGTGTGSGTGVGENSVGAVWKFYNVAMDNSNPASPLQVNATITIDAAYRAAVVDFDDNNSSNQNGVKLPNLFAPTITPDQTLSSSDRSGYVQFKITFYKNTMSGSGNKWNAANYTQTIQLTGLNYVHYDIDGGSANSYAFRETGLVQQLTGSNPIINVNANTELNPYSYTGDGSTWRGFVGSTCERDGASNCSEVVSAFKFSGALSTITFRMGYEYDRISGNGINSRPQRQYASTFGCFAFPQPVILPVKLLSFSGSYNDNATALSWETEAEVNFDHYEIERSSNGSDFIYTGKVAAQAGNEKKQYSFSDNLATVNGSLFYYRLKMIDIDGKFKYSNVILIRKDAKSINGISISPNPVVGNGAATLRITSVTSGKIELRVIDMAGKIVLQQESRVSEGTNSISINNTSRLQSGIYTVQVLQNDEAMNTKISILK